MGDGNAGNTGASGDESLFPDTPWTQLLLARGDDTLARQTLSNVFRLYWYPVYAFVRSQGKSSHDAEDLTQGFFVRLLERNDLGEVDRERGRLRAFLLAAMKNYLRYTQRQDKAVKRGGRQEIVSLDVEMAERRMESEEDGGMSPEKLFEQRWAVTLLEHVLADLEREYQAGGKGEVFAALRGFLSANASPPTYAEAAAELNSNEQATRVAVHRLRKRYRDLLTKHIAATLEDDADIDGELAHLMSVFSAG